MKAEAPLHVRGIGQGALRRPRYTRAGFPLEFGGWSRRRSSPSRKVRAPWAGDWLTASRDDSKESATENKPPRARGNRVVRQG